MRIHSLFQIIKLSALIASLFSLVLFFPCQSGEMSEKGLMYSAALAVPRQNLEQPPADSEFAPPRLATVTEVTAAPGSGPAGSTMEPSSPTVIATGTRFVETAQIGTSTQIATDVRRAKTSWVPLLTGLVRNRPSIWGSKGFYVLLGLIYVTLLGLFIKQVISISGGSHEQG